jgi:3-oxoisoapionate decarboxylase
MKIGISSFTYGWNIGVENSMPATPMTEMELVNQTIAFGLDCLQIGDNLPIHTFDETRKINFKNTLEKNKIRIEIGAKNLTIENLKAYVDFCIFYGSPLLRFIIDGPDYEPNIEQVVNIIQTVLPELEKQNITLGIENHDRFKAKEIAEIMLQVNHKNVGVCLDCVNSIGAGEGLESVAEILAPYTVNLHFKDFKASRLPHKMGFVIEGEIAGKGMTNLPLLLKKIRPFGRCQSVILEQWVPPELDIGETSKKEREWAEIGIGFLKKEITKYIST